MKHLAVKLRDFRRELADKYIVPNLHKKNLTRTVPKKYKTIVDRESWAKFVEYRLSDEFKVR